MKIRKTVKTGELYFKDEIMEKRPQTPESLKKRVLVEAGHPLGSGWVLGLKFNRQFDPECLVNIS